MYTATIEPRLIALLNEQPISIPKSRLDLPHVLNSPNRPFALEPSANTGSQKDDRGIVKSPCHKISELLSAEPATVSREDDGQSSKDKVDKEQARALSSPQSLRKILQTEDESPTQRSVSKKRSRIEAHKDDFVQLPQPPPKKQKAPKQVVPPIIIGLFEPPPNAALFPPISSSAFHDSHGRNTLNVNVPEKGKEKEIASSNLTVVQNHAVSKLLLETTMHSGGMSGPANTRSKASGTAIPQVAPTTAPRKKWSKEETNQLLLGVHKHGIGKWKLILSDSSFKFNGRSAADLKDRFRTCCPAELREQLKNGSSRSTDTPDTSSKLSEEIVSDNPRSTSSILFENILIDPVQDPTTMSNSHSRTASPERAPPTKSRAHRRNLSDLATLGISGLLPFKKSQRRERRLFTEEEDQSILAGYSKYGPQWAKIQANPELGLKDRRSTDIRDRFRNRWKGVYEGLTSGEGSKAGSITRSSMKGKNDMATRHGVPTIPPLQSTEPAINSEKQKMQRGPSSTDLMTLSYNAISNLYPLPTISSQGNVAAGKEIFYQLPNPNSTTSMSCVNHVSSASINSESLMTSSNEQSSFSTTDWSDNILAPFNANGLGMASGMNMETGENGIGMEEFVATFNPSSVMDISRFLQDDNWPLK